MKDQSRFFLGRDGGKACDGDVRMGDRQPLE